MKNNSIAIVGMAAKFPDAMTISSFWQNVVNGRSSVEKFNRPELIKAGVSEKYVNDPDYRPNSAIIKNIDKFDADFFGITKRDAQILDPQFRQFFEVAWWALEDAGLTVENATKNIGVFCSSGMSLYSDKTMNSYYRVNVESNSVLMETLDPIQAKILTLAEYLPTQLSYKLNLTGPSLSVNTACSSSLVSIHLAVQSLLKGECEAALAGASAIHAPHIAGYLYNQGSIFSDDGVCRPFDAKANGIVGGNGVGAVVLKTLANAEKDKDMIYAIINATSINNDGSNKVSYTAPSIDGQKNNIINVLKKSKIDVNGLDFIEAHGTGTKLGDPIEIAALNQALKQLGYNDNKIKIGSVKANIGHLDTAAGIASFIKTACAIYYGVLPGITNFNEPNSVLEIEKTCFELQSQATPWSKPKAERHALVAALGAGGTNAHIVVSGYELKQIIQKNELENKNYFVLFMSGFSKKSLEDNLEKMASFLENSEESLANICYSAACKRAIFSNRCLVIAQNKSQMIKYIREKTKTKFFLGQIISKAKKQHSWANYALDNSARLLDLSQLENLVSDYCIKGLLPYALYQQVSQDSFAHIKLPQYCFDEKRYWIDYQSNTDNKNWIYITEFIQIESPGLLSGNSDNESFNYYEISCDLKQNKVQDIINKLNTENNSGLVIYVEKLKLNELTQNLISLAKILVCIEQSLDKVVKLLLISESALLVSESDEIELASLANAIWSGLRVACHEMINLAPIWLDIGKNTSPLDRNALIEILLTQECFIKGDELACRKQKLYRQELKSLPLLALEDKDSLNKSNLQILLGGNGSIGWQLVDKLAQEGFKNLLIVSRQDKDKEILDKLSNMKIDGCSVHWLTANVAEDSGWEILKSKIKTLNLDVGCIYHLCGVIEDATMSNLNKTLLTNVTQAKIEPLIRLQHCMKWLKPERIVLFSSLSSGLGTAGQYAYAAANGFSDGWSIEQRHKGINVISMQWGPWSGGGMIEKIQKAGKTQHLANLEMMEINKAIELIDICFEYKKAVYTIASLDPVLDNLINKPHIRYEIGKKLFSQDKQQLIQEISPDFIQTSIMGLIHDLVEVEPTHPEFLDLTFSQLGIDSLGVIQIRKLISDRLNVKLSVSDLYSNPSVRKLLEFLNNKLKRDDLPKAKLSGTYLNINDTNLFDEQRELIIDEICSLI